MTTSAPRAAHADGAFVPTLPSGTKPLYVPDAVAPAAGSTVPAGFGCFGACGASCDCVHRADATRVTHESGHVCTWKTVTCETHSFCRWHDGCYQSCDSQFPGREDDGSWFRPLCYRACDLACVDGHDPKPIGGWDPAELNPGTPPETLGAVKCLERLSNAPLVPYDGTFTYADLVSCEEE